MKITTWLFNLDETDCEGLLSGSSLGRIGVIVDGQPEIFPVNYVFDQERRCVAFPTDEGTKLHAALNWPSVAFEIDGMSAPDSGWSVLVVGRAEEITDADDIVRFSELREAVWRVGDQVRWIRIVPTKVTGRRIMGPAD